MNLLVKLMPNRMTQWCALGVVTLICVLLLAFAANQKVAASNTVQLWGDPAKEKIQNLYGPVPSTDGKRHGVKIHDSTEWQVYRQFPSGYLEVFHKQPSGALTRIDLPLGWRRDTYPMLMMPSPGRLLVVGYDVVRNVPSGRRLAVEQPGFDLIEIGSENNQLQMKSLASGIDLGAGIDSMVYGRLLGDGVSLCSERRCASVSRRGGIRYWSLDSLDGYEFVEVAFDSKSTFAIARKTWDDRSNGAMAKGHADYFHAELKEEGAKIVPAVGNGVPFGLVVVNGKPAWKMANSVQDFRDLFLYDLSRMRNHGLIDFGENNLEGRVAWSQAYYLNGLISVGSGRLPLYGDTLKKIANERVKTEIELVARLAENDYPGYRVKRYSMEREPLLFALHLGRISHLLARAQSEQMASVFVKLAIDKIKAEMLALNLTVERIGDCQVSNMRVNACKTLFYRQGYPFWADGANVPFNFVSGYVAGLLSSFDDVRTLELSGKLMQPLREMEGLENSPKSWRYWWGEGQAGWRYENGNSLNTPAWQGNAAGSDIAHITYRSMDAMALMMLHERGGDWVTRKEILHFKSLVESGMLLPQLNEQLSLMGLTAKLPPFVAKRYARSSQAWQMQSQVWALSELMALASEDK